MFGHHNQYSFPQYIKKAKKTTENGQKPTSLIILSIFLRKYTERLQEQSTIVVKLRRRR
jgi:hypothetical protein